MILSCQREGNQLNVVNLMMGISLRESSSYLMEIHYYDNFINGY